MQQRRMLKLVHGAGDSVSDSDGDTRRRVPRMVLSECGAVSPERLLPLAELNMRLEETIYDAISRLRRPDERLTGTARRIVIEAAIRKHGGNMTAAADEIGIARQNLLLAVKS